MEEFILTCQCGHEEGGCSEPQCIPLIKARMCEHLKGKHVSLLHSLAPTSTNGEIDSYIEKLFIEMVSASYAGMHEAYAP